MPAPLGRELVALVLARAQDLLGRPHVCALERLHALLRHPAAPCRRVLLPAPLDAP